MAGDNIRTDIRLYMRARVIGSVQPASQLMEFPPASISPSLTPYTIHFTPLERNVFIRNEILPRTLRDMALMR